MPDEKSAGPVFPIIEFSGFVDSHWPVRLVFRCAVCHSVLDYSAAFLYHPQCECVQRSHRFGLAANSHGGIGFVLT